MLFSNTQERQVHLDNFWRVAQPLRCMKVDLNYHKTRKALDPNWDGYVRDGHDISDDDCDPIEANIVTSLHRDSDQHSVVLDLDNGAYTSVPLLGNGHIRLIMEKPIWFDRDKTLVEMLETAGITEGMPKPMIHRPNGSPNGFIDIFTKRDFVLLPSSTKGHNHLIIDTKLDWSFYDRLLQAFVDCHILEARYVAASRSRKFTAIRMPWVKKDLEQWSQR